MKTNTTLILVELESNYIGRPFAVEGAIDAPVGFKMYKYNKNKEILTQY